MRAPQTTTKIPPDALRLLRMIAASTGEKQYEVMLRLFEAEAKRLQMAAFNEVMQEDRGILRELAKR